MKQLDLTKIKSIVDKQGRVYESGYYNYFKKTKGGFDWYFKASNDFHEHLVFISKKSIREINYN
jgi:hypothetical protein